MITLRISKRYQYLVRNNSVFWLASGYSLDFGLTGGVVKTGTFNQFIRGGIAFATPPVRRWRQKRKPVSISCYKRANRKSGVNGVPLCHVKHRAPAYSRRSVLCYTARLFFAGDTPVAQHAVYFPDAFLTQMREAMPSTLSFDEFISACQRPLRRSIRINTLKISVADFLALIAPYGWSLTPIPWCHEGFWIERDDEEALPLGSTAEHLSGLFYIQEASSMLPVAALFADDNHPQRVMDMAAAPGSKTTQIAARMGNRGAILANEFSASRVKVLHANISRCGIANTALTHFDGRVFGAALPEMFDAILLDAPCSGEGVVRKDPDALKTGRQKVIWISRRHSGNCSTALFMLYDPAARWSTPPAR